jgi:hypothetical protein
MKFSEWMLRDIKVAWENRYAVLLIILIILIFFLISPYLPSSSSTCDTNSTVCRTNYGMR